MAVPGLADRSDKDTPPRPYKARVAIGKPLSGLSAEERALFFADKALFEHELTPTGGLGPLYNATSCVKCHAHPATGGSEPGTVDNVIHYGAKHEDRFLEVFELGGPVRQRFTIAGHPEAPDCNIQLDDVEAAMEAIAPFGTKSVRHAPPVFGFGLIDAIPDAQILANHTAPRKHSSVKGFANFGVELEIVGAFSDFLVHLMGEELSDGRQMGRADGKHWRTTPLWGVRFKTNLLYDGSATSIEEAILRHSGEAWASRQEYASLSAEKQDKVLAFAGPDASP